MTSGEIERIRQIASDILQLSPDKITPQTCREDVDDWDSAQHLNLILALELEFNTVFEPEEMDRMNSLEEIERVIGSKLHSR